MTPSPACSALIKSFEQCRLRAYKPTPNDVWTCGWGSTGPDVGPTTVWTQAQADTRFDTSLASFAAGVAHLLTGSTTQPQFDAMVSLAYNIGLGNFGPSTLLKMHNAGDYAGAAAQFSRWNKQAGEVLAGLTRRRAAEAALYQEPQA